MGITADVVGKLDELPAGSVLAINTDTESYFDVLRALVDVFATRHDLYVFYISSTIPSKSIQSLFEMLGIDSSRVFFVDTISHLMKGDTEFSDRFLYIESPTMLEYIMLKVEYLTRKYSDKKAIVVLDSVNSMSIYNSHKIMSEFLHMFVTSLRSWDAYMVMITMKEQNNQDIKSILNMVCDDIYEVGGGE
jgi:KaiC/GvpD/RAD55 family RecA-like ATPase